jgi:FSR family fosmidomycin resistance protein-like MFS transporter
MSAVATPVVLPSAVTEPDRAGLRLLTLAHVFTDLNQGVLPATIPFLILHRHLSLAAAATLILAANLLGSVVQLLFGYLSDKRSTTWVIPAALVVAAAGTAMVGLAPSLPLMLAGAMLAGIGVAAFHPEGSRFSNYFAGHKRASGMSFFTLGGYVGFAIGPIVATPLILAFGLPGIALLLVPAVIVAGLLLREMPRFNEVRRVAHRAHRERPGADDWRGFGMMAIVVALRSTAFLAAVTFTEVFAMHVTHASPSLGSFVLCALLLGGAAGTIAGGRLADRIDRRRVVSLSLGLTMLSAAALALTGAAFHLFVLTAILAPIFGISLGLSSGVLVVVGQEYLPKHIGIASGVTLGLANTIGGIAAPAFGRIGDAYGLVMVFATIAAFAFLALACSFLMPKPNSASEAMSSRA